MVDKKPENDEIDVYKLEDEELVEEYREMVEIIRHGDPDAVTPKDKRKFEVMRSELILRLSEEILT